MKKHILYIFTLSLITSVLYSQNDSTISIGFVLPEIKIEREKAGKVVTNHFENEYNLFSISNDTLFGDHFKNNYKSALSDISSVSILNGNEGGRGAWFGALFGFIGGFLWGAIQQSNTLSEGDHDLSFCMLKGFFIGAAFSMPGALIGSFLGLLTPHYAVIEINKGYSSGKKEKIINSLSEIGYRYSKKGNK